GLPGARPRTPPPGRRVPPPRQAAPAAPAGPQGPVRPVPVAAAARRARGPLRGPARAVGRPDDDDDVGLRRPPADRRRPVAAGEYRRHRAPGGRAAVLHLLG